MVMCTTYVYNMLVTAGIDFAESGADRGQWGACNYAARKPKGRGISLAAPADGWGVRGA